MSVAERMKEEVKTVGLTTLFFVACFFTMMAFKALVLVEYKIAFFNFSAALIGALVVAKVVLVIEKVPLGAWLRKQSGIVHIAIRTAMYGAAVCVALLLEKAFEARHEYGGFVPALTQVLAHRDMPHVWATIVGVISALLVFNVLLVIRRHLGTRAMLALFISPLPREAPRERIDVGRDRMRSQ